MLEQAMLREQFLALLQQQRQAAQIYSDLAEAGDEGIRKQVQQLQHDKNRHIQLTERLLEIVD